METSSNLLNSSVGVAKHAVVETKRIFHIDEVASIITMDNIIKIVTGVVALLIFFIVYRVVVHIVKKSTAKKLQEHSQKLILKIIKYTFYVLVVMYVLGLFGINLQAIWGAAGIAGVALGFAAQTSVSNLISGIFVVTEKTFKIGDYIEVDGIAGTVDSIGLLSVKARTLDNQVVRIPNSTIINSKLINYSYHKYRRQSFLLLISYDDDFKKAFDVIMKIPEFCPTVIKDDELYKPAAIFNELGDCGVEVKLNVWFERKDLLQTKNDVLFTYKKLFDENGLTIPFVHYDVKLVD